jgi:broad specificity phosphatase PhoE
MTRLLLVRHGQTAWNALGKLQGHTDIELDDTGRDQARALVAALRAHTIAAVWASDLARARQTAEIIAAALGLPPPSIDVELRERRFGVFEGLTRDECAAQFPEAWRAWLDRTGTPQGAETREVVLARMTRALNRVIATTPGTALVVTHGGVMRTWLMEHLSASVGPIMNGSIHAVDHDGTRFRLG